MAPQVMLAFCVSSLKDTVTCANDTIYIEKECPRILSPEHQYHGIPWTQKISSPWHPTHGLLGQHLCVWASHGKYYKSTKQQWCWQRPSMFCTTEDLLTPSFVYTFLMPMLENAGAIVWTPRERDMQSHMELASVPTEENRKQYLWELNVPEDGEYAVYIRYPKIPNAVPDAIYSIYHGGERTRIAVNQRMGYNTWVYLGKYHFSGTAKIALSKSTRYNGMVALGEVRIGGGIGHITRNHPSDSLSVPLKSDIPHYLEGARYYSEWAGLPDSLYNTEGGLDDYKDDLRSRSNYLNYLKKQGVPFLLSLAVHTDAGYRNDTLPYGSLAICTTEDAEGRHNYGDIISRMSSKDFCDTLLRQLQMDLGNCYKWQLRGVRDKNYSETRVPDIPSAIIELLSHQNFLDARLAHDPVFKFRICRSIYKSILRYAYSLQGLIDPIVQPLPVHGFSARIDKDESIAELRWKATTDSLEDSAMPTHYILYTRLDNGDYDNGQLIDTSHYRQRILPNHQYSFYVTAVNAGGESFPSNKLSVFIGDEPTEKHGSKDSRHLLLVDAFTRLSGPAYIDTPDSAGFLLEEDTGVPFRTTLEYSGPQLCFDRKYIGLEGPGGLGHSSIEDIGKPVIGNHFDICQQRTDELVRQYIQHPTDTLLYISSTSVEELPSILEQNPEESYEIYYLAGLQRRAPHNMADYPVWPEMVRDCIERHIRKGKRLHVEGKYISPEDLSPEERDWWVNIQKP